MEFLTSRPKGSPGPEEKGCRLNGTRVKQRPRCSYRAYCDTTFDLRPRCGDESTLEFESSRVIFLQGSKLNSATAWVTNVYSPFRTAWTFFAYKLLHLVLTLQKNKAWAHFSVAQQRLNAEPVVHLAPRLKSPLRKRRERKTEAVEGGDGAGRGYDIGG